MVDTNIPCCLELLVNNSVLLGEPVDTIVGLSHPPDGSTDGVCLVSHGHTSGGLVNLGDVDLDAGVVLGGQDTVTGGALPWDVKINIISGFVLHVDLVICSSLKKIRDPILVDDHQ